MFPQTFTVWSLVRSRLIRRFDHHLTHFFLYLGRHCKVEDVQTAVENALQGCNGLIDLEINVHTPPALTLESITFCWRLFSIVRRNQSWHSAHPKEMTSEPYDAVSCPPFVKNNRRNISETSPWKRKAKDKWSKEMLGPGRISYRRNQVRKARNRVWSVVCALPWRRLGASPALLCTSFPRVLNILDLFRHFLFLHQRLPVAFPFVKLGHDSWITTASRRGRNFLFYYLKFQTFPCKHKIIS